VADPLTLFRQPENLFVAGFIGSPPMNLLKGKIQKQNGSLIFVENAEANPLTLPLRGNAEALGAKHVDKEVVFGIRPEQISNEPHDANAPIHLKVEIAEPMGSESLVYLKTGSGSIIARIQGDHIFHLGEDVPAYFEMEKGTFFDPKTENMLK
jgi:multiple sugar transport system ATP-binding protein